MVITVDTGSKPQPQVTIDAILRVRLATTPI